MKGVPELAGIAHDRQRGLVELLATFIYMVSVEHEIVDSAVWDYHLWSDVSAPASTRTVGGCRSTSTNVWSTTTSSSTSIAPGCGTTSRTSPSTTTAAAFRRFSRDLHDLQDAWKWIRSRESRQRLAHRAAQPQGEHQLLTPSSRRSWTRPTTRDRRAR